MPEFSIRRISGQQVHIGSWFITKTALSFPGGDILSYVSNISGAADTWIVSPTAAQQAAAASTDPVFADILAAQLDARMMNIVMDDGNDNELSGSADLAQAVLLGALLSASSSQPAQPAAVPEEVSEAPAAADTVTIAGPAAAAIPDAGGLSVTQARPGPMLAVTSVYAGPSLAVYADPVSAYGQFDISDISRRSPEELQAARQLAADYALERQGDPYSQSKRGVDNYVDCSYLTKWAFRQTGINLPATAAEQARYCAANGYEISASELEKGDLVFWTKKGCSCGRYDEIHHVAVYIGDGKIVEASSSRGEVVVNSMWGADGIGSWRIAMCARPQ